MADESTPGAREGAPSPPGSRFVWYELATPDPDAVADFYAAVAGWGVERQQHGDAVHLEFTAADGRRVGGGGTVPDGASSWLGYVAVEDLEATLTRAVELGGRLIEPVQELGGGSLGSIATLGDPQGGSVGLYQAGDTPPPSDGASGGEDGAADLGPGQITWHELATTDHGAALAFYGALFGWTEVDRHDMGPELGIYRMIGTHPGATAMGAMWNKPAEMAVAWLYYVQVEDIQAAAAAVEPAGGRVLNGPMEVPGGDWVVQAIDPEGAAFALTQKGS